MALRFTKMHGLGNDFVVLDGVNQPVQLTSEQIRALADRRFGVGCDQVLLVEPPRTPETLFRYRIFNADGSEVEQCGNGARCFARFVADKGLTEARSIPVETAGGVIELHLEGRDQVRVDMGPPVFEPQRIPFQAPAQAARYDLALDGEVLQVGALSMGNPHVVLQVPSVDEAPVARLGPLLEAHPRFPNRVNVGFMEVVSREHIRLRVYERGVGETLACGTGACAAMVSGRVQGLLDPVVKVDLSGGPLMISWVEPGQSVLMTGPAQTVYEGQIEL